MAQLLVNIHLKFLLNFHYIFRTIQSEKKELQLSETAFLFEIKAVKKTVRNKQVIRIIYFFITILL